ncbi:hypothetical protein [Shinella zoogloeoides]|uniref:hypothetical protein n=1 Tax=Shinella zoogloeoides TaxID=352475 RepID=UPI00299D1F74|nr:hypothetical protein [Shinella zoogloeoides]
MVIGKSNVVGRPVWRSCCSERLHGDRRPFAHEERTELPTPSSSRSVSPRGELDQAWGGVLDVGWREIAASRVVGDVAFEEDPPHHAGSRRRLTIACLLANALTSI